jgi:hypothetical protein
MGVTSQPIAGECVKYAGAEEGGAKQDVDDVEHGDVPRSATKAAACGWHVALHNN